MIGNLIDFREVRAVDRTGRMATIVILSIIFGAFISDCSSVANQPGYFLFTPPFGGNRPPQEFSVSKRNGAEENNDIASLSRAHITPAETLWVGSHSINWSPLPIFQKIVDHHEHKQQQRFAQARKFDMHEQQSQNAQKGPFFSTRSFKNNFNSQSIHPHKKHLFNNPHHDFSNKITSGGFFAGLGASIGNKDAPKVIPPNFAQPRSSVQPEKDYAEPPRNQPTTPLPSFQSSTGTILVSPPGTIRALSTPGPNLNPIVNRLRKMTEWSKHKSPSASRKEKSTSSRERRLRLKKRTREERKQHKDNIAAIILSNDDDEGNESVSDERNNIRIVKANLQLAKPEKLRKPKSVKRKRKSRGRDVSKEQTKHRLESSEEIVITQTLQRPNKGLVVIHPTNAAFHHDPMDSQSSRKNFELKRKDKGLFFQAEETANKPGPVSFRFGADDAKPNPYANLN